MRTSRGVLEPGKTGIIAAAATRAGCEGERVGWLARDDKEAASTAAALGDIFGDEGADDRLGSTLQRGDPATRFASEESILKNEIEAARLVACRHA